MLIETGTQVRLVNETTNGPGSTSIEGSIKSDSLVATLWVDSLASGSLDVSVYTLTDEGKEVLLFSFPSITGPSTLLLLRKSGVSLQRFRVVATYTDVCSYEIYIRATEGSGESSVRILGSAALETDSIEVTTTPDVLVPSALVDRSGLSLLNYSGGGILYISEDITKLPARAWPVQAGGGWSLDIAAGVTIYAVSSAGTLDVRIAQSGG
jgi:hypothetical protein